jgi:hypothetical protein
MIMVAPSDSIAAARRRVAVPGAHGPALEEQRLARAEAAAQKSEEREQRAQQVEAGRTEASQRTEDLVERVASLEAVLDTRLDRPARIDLRTVMSRDTLPKPLAQEEFEQAERVHAQNEAARREWVRDQQARHGPDRLRPMFLVSLGLRPSWP